MIPYSLEDGWWGDSAYGLSSAYVVFCGTCQLAQSAFTRKSRKEDGYRIVRECCAAQWGWQQQLKACMEFPDNVMRVVLACCHPSCRSEMSVKEATKCNECTCNTSFQSCVKRDNRAPSIMAVTEEYKLATVKLQLVKLTLQIVALAGLAWKCYRLALFCIHGRVTAYTDLAFVVFSSPSKQYQDGISIKPWLLSYKSSPIHCSPTSPTCSSYWLHCKHLTWWQYGCMGNRPLEQQQSGTGMVCNKL
jgi:hypothetical protein